MTDDAYDIALRGIDLHTTAIQAALDPLIAAHGKHPGREATVTLSLADARALTCFAFSAQQDARFLRALRAGNIETPRIEIAG